MAAVLGRDEELAQVERFLEIDRGRGIALILEGEAGIGKTTVWREALRLADERGFRICACQAAQAEAKLAFAALSDLLARVPEGVFAEIAEPQREALDVALLRRAGGPVAVDPRAVAAGLVSVLARLAQASPLLVAVDDAQWLDGASAAALSFAFRRLGDQLPAAALVAVRVEPDGRSDVLGLDALAPAQRQRLGLGPLSVSSLFHALNDRLGVVFPRPTLQRIQHASGGNPFFALEIGRLLAQRSVPPAGEPLPIPPDVQALLRRRVRRLPAATREVLLAAALLGEPTVDAVRCALSREIDAEVEPAERAQLARREGGRITFAHPLVAAAISASAPAAARRRMHRRLAESVDGLEERARHLALAVEGRDENVATVVHEAARQAFRRGAPATAAELVELALALGEPDADAEATRLLDLADWLDVIGEPLRARELLEGIAWRSRSINLQERAAALLCTVVSQTAHPREATEVCERLLEEGTPDPVRARLHAWLGYAMAALDAHAAADHADAALILLEQLGADADPRTHVLVPYVRLRARVLLGFGVEEHLVARVLEAEERLPEATRYFDRGSYALGYFWKFVDDVEGSQCELERALRRAQDSGEETLSRFLLEHLAVTECWAGDLAAALRHARAAAGGVAEEPGVPQVISAVGSLALAQAYVGDIDRVRALAAHAAAVESYAASIQFHAAFGLAELSIPDYRAAYAHLCTALETFQRCGFGEPGVYRFHADAAEAAAAVDDIDTAEQVAEFIEGHGRRTGRRSSLATGARARALVAAARGDVDHALAAVQEAMEWHEDLPLPFERARTLLVKGVIERRLRRRGQAKTSFERALAIFGEIGARRWAERARLELGRTGLRRATANELTESERRVAELSARGLTRRQVAAELSVSPKTVDATLVRAYRKLGVHSRAELGARMAGSLQT